MLQAPVLIPLLLIALLVKPFLDAGKAELAARYRLSVRRFAEKALSRGPRGLEDHPEGHNWIAGMDMIWTTPPTVRAVKPHLQQICEVEPKARLVSVDDEPTEGLGREEVLKLLSGSASVLNFMKGKRWQQKKDEERLLKRLDTVIRKPQEGKGSHRGFRGS
ncbi:unnamed protein product [Symbiodinium sp. CCMP2592]|nr:unnamed protein product [Symbiodinium sp. CCMP2592]